MTPCPLPQSREFARTLAALGTRTHRLPVPGGETACLVQTRRLPLLGPVNLISRGPDLPPADAAAWLARLDLPGPLCINSLGNLGAGFLRLAAPKEVALLPLGDPARMRRAMHPNWRASLRRAERAALAITNEPFDPARHGWLIDAETRQQKNRRYRNWPARFTAAFAKENAGKLRVLSAGGTRTVAAMMILCHPPWASYHLGVTSDEGRAACAHHRLLF
ncbi:GNAT family N-acetyltransferase [Marivita sp. GX14005]|uniref:GNAT family N-acetyltransferase n=1 Tax=Marivita sp. GX14005 TaxID=2942276 RepID=UPI00201A1F93|nr:GNAT family N-acetyltransferase [Marivita sp. GX14005]MCL3883679.1 GNAT family N-acetyltransferase [Marivita sp. GX14005]